MSLIDYLLYYDEDNDIESEAMSEWTPVQPSHLVELHDRGLLTVSEVFSHKGWHHVLDTKEGKLVGTMWDGPLDVGEYRWSGEHDDNTWY